MLQQPASVTEGLKLLKAKLDAKQELEAEIEDLKLFLSDRISPYKPGEITVKQGWGHKGKPFRVEGTTLQIWGFGTEQNIRLSVFGKVLHKNGKEARESWVEPAAPHFEKVLQQEKDSK